MWFFLFIFLKIPYMKKTAFTLVELLVTITIMGVLATITMNIYNSQIKKSQDATRIEDLKSLETAMYAYFSDNNKFVSKPQISGNQFTGWNDAETRDRIKEVRDQFLRYMTSIPSDPLSATQTVLFPKWFQGPAANNLGTYTEYGYNTDNWDYFELSAALAIKNWDDAGDDPHRLEIHNGANPSLDTDAPTTTRYVNAAVPGFTCLGGIWNIYNSCSAGTFIVIKQTDDAFIDAFTP